MSKTKEKKELLNYLYSIDSGGNGRFAVDKPLGDDLEDVVSFVKKQKPLYGLTEEQMLVFMGTRVGTFMATQFQTADEISSEILGIFDGEQN